MNSSVINNQEMITNLMNPKIISAMGIISILSLTTFIIINWRNYYFFFIFLLTYFLFVAMIMKNDELKNKKLTTEIQNDENDKDYANKTIVLETDYYTLQEVEQKNE